MQVDVAGARILLMETATNVLMVLINILATNRAIQFAPQLIMQM
jgi:hypothetical protein